MYPNLRLWSVIQTGVDNLIETGHCEEGMKQDFIGIYKVLATDTAVDKVVEDLKKTNKN